MINYIEKGIGLHKAITAAGQWLSQVNGVWVSSNDAIVQAIIDAYNPLPDQKNERIDAIKADGLARMNAAFPALTSLDEVAFYAEFWSSIAAAARTTPTVPFKKIIDIYVAAKTAITAVGVCTTKAQIDAVTVAWPA